MYPSRAIYITPIVLLSLLLTFVIGGELFAKSDKKKPELGENHALIIGINDYAQWPKLKSPVGDAEAIAKVLTEKYNFKKSKIKLITDKTQDKPTLINILTALDEYVKTLKEKDNLLIFFSGQSTEDDEGETYWIPIDGKKTTQLTWLKHIDLIEAYLGSENFKVKNLCVISDSMFNSKLVRRYTVSVGFDNLRYEEKIAERARRQSREVIAFGDEHWPASNDTEGLGLFTYHIHKALSENDLDILDFENLIFDESIIFPISKIAGAKLLGGRLRTKMAKKGQYVIARTIPLPVVNLAETTVSPQKGYPGDDFTFKVKTTSPAFEVFVEIDGKKQTMKGKGKDWTFAAKFDKLGKFPYKVFATNENDVAGKSEKGEITVIKKRAEVANVVQATVSPKEGDQGEEYKFSVKTDSPAKSVAIRIKGKSFNMSGSGTDWTFSKAVEEIGTVAYSAIATNEDEVTGAEIAGNMTIRAVPVNIANVTTSPKEGFAGEEFQVAVTTDRDAESVSLKMDGTDYPMEGSGKSWRFKRTITDIGTKSFTVSAINVDGKPGKEKTGQIIAKKAALPIPNVASVNVNVVKPGKGYVGDKYAIKVKTTIPSDKVFIEIDGRRYPMRGSGSDWKLTAKIARLGTTNYRILAVNKDGAQGTTQEGAITTRKRPAPPVKVAKAVVKPVKGHSARPFTFNVTTDRPAKGVTLIIGKTRYKMKGKGTQWQLSQKVKDAGKLTYSVSALNKDGRPGPAQKGNFVVYKQRYRPDKDGSVTDLLTGKKAERFVDNGDGTITDLVTSLMWLQTPKQIAVTYNEAVEYCKTLKIKDYTGWRLPTIGELNKLTDKKRQNPALPAGNPFLNVVTHVGYWSKTRHKFGPQYVYQMSLWYGKANHQKKDAESIVWPVRYAELPEG